MMMKKKKTFERTEERREFMEYLVNNKREREQNIKKEKKAKI